MIHHRGYTLIELIVSVGLFSLVMLMASGAYLMMISSNRNAQGITTGIDNLSFALETMTRNIRTGTGYGCPIVGVDCPNGASSFSFTNTKGIAVTYDLLGTMIQETTDGEPSILTDSSVNISSLKFYVFGTSSADTEQPRVTMVISGTVSVERGQTESFTIETGATMRGSDI